MTTEFVQAAQKAQVEEAVQKWQKAAHIAQRHADACYAEAQAKEEEAAEATAQVWFLLLQCPAFGNCEGELVWHI